MGFKRMICIGMTAAILSGCGDGWGGPESAGNNYVFPAGKTTLAFSAISTAKLPASIGSIYLKITLPPGMSVETSGAAGRQVTTSSITPGAGLLGTNFAFGRYSASTGEVQLSMITNNDSYRSGEFLRLTCSVAPGTNITLGSLKALNTPVAVVNATGYKAVDNNPFEEFPLTNLIKVELKVP